MNAAAIAPCRVPEPLVRPQRGWAGLPVTLESLPARLDLRDVLLPEPLIAVVRGGSGKRWITSERRTRELRTAPGMIELFRGGFQVDHARWDGTSGDVVQIRFPAGMVVRLLQDDTRPLDLETRHEVFDPALTQLAMALWTEASSEEPLGSLYVEGITLALLGLLASRYRSGGTEQNRRIAKFGARDAERLRAAITAQLADDLRIERLAAMVSMSPCHFAKMFKATFGQSPHAFVIEQRIDAASRALRIEAERPIADIASAVGFSSQAHFSDAFRRRVGTTPARWRADS